MFGLLNSIMLRAEGVIPIDWLIGWPGPHTMHLALLHTWVRVIRETFLLFSLMCHKVNKRQARCCCCCWIRLVISVNADQIFTFKVSIKCIIFVFYIVIFVEYEEYLIDMQDVYSRQNQRCLGSDQYSKITLKLHTHTELGLFLFFVIVVSSRSSCPKRI